MKLKDAVANIRSGKFEITEIVDEIGRDELRRLVVELDYALYNTGKKLAREALRDQDDTLRDIYGDLADQLEEAWTYDGQWFDEG